MASTKANSKRKNLSELQGKDEVHYQRLLALRDELVDEVRSLSDAGDQNRQAGEELADIGGDNFLREVELGLLTDEQKRLMLIQDALERLSNGTYGTCQDCKKPIGEARLEAIPYAKLCVNCKARREEEESSGAHPLPREEREDLSLTE